jgi:hypothetical protein
MEIQESLFLYFAGAASAAAIETGNSVEILVIADLGSATRAASTQPNHQVRPREGHQFNRSNKIEALTTQPGDR